MTLLRTFEQCEMWVMSQTRQKDVMEITTSASTQIHITHVGASVLLREVGCHSTCVEYITRAAENNMGERRNGVGGQILWFGILFNANEITLHSRLQWVTVDMELMGSVTWGLGSWMNERGMLWFPQSYCPLLCNGGPTSAAIMEAEKRLGPVLTLVITRETQRKTLIHSVISSTDSILTPPPACLLVCRAPDALHSDWGWLLYYFINYVFPLPLPLPPVERGWRSDALPLLCPLAFHALPHPPTSITADHCLNFSSLLSLPCLSLVFLLSPLISSQIALYIPPDSPLSLSLPLSVLRKCGGKDLRHASYSHSTSPHLSRSHLCLSSGFHRCSVIISTLIWRYLLPLKCRGVCSIFAV